MFIVCVDVWMCWSYSVVRVCDTFIAISHAGCFVLLH
jgi:hypothetical protein